MTYKQQVRAAAAALKQGDDANWQLARLTYESTLNHNERNPTKVTMTQWCADIASTSGRKFTRDTGRRYKAVWASHGADRHHENWADAYWTVRGTDAQTSFEGANKGQIAKASPEVKRETFRALASDPAITGSVDKATGEIVADLIRRSPVAAGHARAALDDRAAKPSLTSDDMAPTSDPRTLHDDAEDLTVAMMLLRKIRKDIRELAVLVSTDQLGVRGDDRDGIVISVQGLRSDLEAIEAALTGDTFDDALAAILEGES